MKSFIFTACSHILKKLWHLRHSYFLGNSEMVLSCSVTLCHFHSPSKPTQLCSYNILLLFCWFLFSPLNIVERLASCLLQRDNRALENPGSAHQKCGPMCSELDQLFLGKSEGMGTDGETKYVSSTLVILSCIELCENLLNKM